MDLSDLPAWFQYAVTWGPLGVWFGVSIVLLVKQNKAHHATRDAHEKDTKDAAKEFGERLEAQATLHHEQMTELTTRFVTQNQEAFTTARQVTEQTTKLVEAITRHMGGK